MKVNNKNSNINCDVDDDNLFPPFQHFVNNSKLYYCYLRFVYNYSIDGGLLPDQETIILDANGRLHVPIDDDSLFLNDGLLKSKGKNPDDITIKVNSSDLLSVPIDNDSIYVSGGLVKAKSSIQPDDITIKLDGNNHLTVPIDYDTIYLDGTVIKSKQTEGRSYSSTGLNIDNINNTINFKDPALTDEQIRVQGDIRLNTWIAVMNNNLSLIENALNNKVDNVDITTNTPDLITISKVRTDNDISFNIDAGQVSFTDLSELRVGQIIDSVIIENTDKISTYSKIDFKQESVGSLEFFEVNKSVKLNYEDLNVTLVLNNVPSTSFVTDNFNWDPVEMKLGFKELTETTSNDLNDVGVGEYILKSVTGLQDVNLSSDDNFLQITKNTSNNTVSFILSNPNGDYALVEDIILAERAALGVFDG